MTADQVTLIDWDEAHADVPDLDLALPHNAAGLDSGAYDIAAQASAAWEAAVCWDDAYALKRLAEVRAVLARSEAKTASNAGFSSAIARERLYVPGTGSVKENIAHQPDADFRFGSKADIQVRSTTIDQFAVSSCRVRQHFQWVRFFRVNASRFGKGGASRPHL
jgi:hypothetical protein